MKQDAYPRHLIFFKNAVCNKIKLIIEGWIIYDLNLFYEVVKKFENMIIIEINMCIWLYLEQQVFLANDNKID